LHDDHTRNTRKKLVLRGAKHKVSYFKPMGPKPSKVDRTQKIIYRKYSPRNEAIKSQFS
jgi:hypothetical protein